MAAAERPRVAYLVHDLNDAAVARRVTMLRAAGADVRVAGFWRGDAAPATVAGAPAIDLGRTADAALSQRSAAIGRHLLRPGLIRRATAGADVILARNLEALLLAARARRGARLVYECLDIHRTLVGTGPASRAIQAVEARLLRRADLLLVSSPAFIDAHFAAVAGFAVPWLLVENKLLRLGGPAPAHSGAPDGPPWTIGWFGMLRCRRTLDLLKHLAARLAGRVEVLIAGKPSAAVFPDLAAEAAAAPHVTFAGAYSPDALPALYGRCHFAWAIDYFEEGLNSRWLLPNRLYEAAAHGVVPIALGEVETGHWLAAHSAGLLLDDGHPAGQLADVLQHLDPAGYRALAAGIAAIPREALVATQADCDALLAAMCGR